MRLIDADGVIEKVKLLIQADKEAGCIGTRLFTLKNVIDFLNEAETIDPEYGFWVFTGKTYKCSNCCFKVDNSVESDSCDLPLLNFRYCPNCGVKIVGVRVER